MKSGENRKIRRKENKKKTNIMKNIDKENRIKINES